MILFEGGVRVLMRKSQNVLRVFNSSLCAFLKSTNRFLLVSVVRLRVRVGRLKLISFCQCGTT